MVVTDQLLVDEASEAYLQRKHFRVQETGYAHTAAASAGPKGIPPSVVARMKDARDNAWFRRPTAAARLGTARVERPREGAN